MVRKSASRRLVRVTGIPDPHRMDDANDIIADWVADEILPHEALVRGWLARRWGHVADVEDVLQEAYCRIAGLSSVEHIESGKSYLFATVQSIVMDGMRRAKVANIRVMTEIDWNYVMDDTPLPDRVVEGRQELDRVREALSDLSQIAQQVIELRRLHGLSQKETARRLGISEHVVENHMVRGLRKVLAKMAIEETAGEEKI